jgi:hypothetical protein
MKARLAIFLVALMILAPLAQATEIRQFDRMNGDDQIKLVDKLVDSVETAAQKDPAQLAKVKRFFMDKQPGEQISGMGRFELSLSLARIGDMDAAAKNPKAQRLHVEDVMYAVLYNSGIRFSSAFRPQVINFQPQKPLGPPLTRQDADKALAQTRSWISREVHELDHGGPAGETVDTRGWSGWSDDQKAIAFFTAWIGLAYGLGKALNLPNGGADTGSVSGSNFEQDWRHAQAVGCAASLASSCNDVNGNPYH